jgi:hypothetical protein
MKHLLIFLLVVGSGSVRGQGSEMTSDDMGKFTAGPGYLIAWYNHEGIAEIFREKDFYKGKGGVLCFKLEYHQWYACSCKTIDSSINAIRYRYKHDKEFKREEDSATRSALERFEKLFEIDEELKQYEKPLAQ